MRTESSASAFANMSAPPRSTVTLPRLASSACASDVPCDGPAMGAGAGLQTLHRVPVGSGGGKLLSNALCVARVELPTAVCAYPFSINR